MRIFFFFYQTTFAIYDTNFRNHHIDTLHLKFSLPYLLIGQPNHFGDHIEKYYSFNCHELACLKKKLQFSSDF